MIAPHVEIRVRDDEIMNDMLVRGSTKVSTVGTDGKGVPFISNKWLGYYYVLDRYCW